jgi:hypothetical protein
MYLVLLKHDNEKQLVELRDRSADELAKSERRQRSPFPAVAADVSAPLQFTLNDITE